MDSVTQTKPNFLTEYVPEHTPPIGDHKGQFAVYNVHNPQPGYRYQWGVQSRWGQIISSQQNGWELVTSSCPEAQGITLPKSMGKSEDGYFVVGELILMRIPEERYRELREEHKQRTLDALQGPTERFRGAASDGDARLGYLASSQGTFFAHPEHGQNGYSHESQKNNG